MKRIITVLLSFMLLFGASASSFAASKKKNYSRSSYSYKSIKPKTVRVKGYYHKNGTYVSPHTRSKPTRKYQR
ncbi:MAG: hypothetical protein LBT07_01985 [Endomicrobium sp.]|jgi:hypothetical protein|nr:hypothetical protein [Endomicrobium sp.]